MKKNYSRTTTLRVIGAGSLIAFGLLLGNVASSFAASKNAVISSCVNRETGDMRYLRKGSCKRTELMVSWNVQGPTGLVGDEGQQGLQGPRGPGGEDGRIGPTGPVGSPGPAGPPGADGSSQTILSNTMRSGIGAPVNSLGADGDFYIDTSSNKIHGPKSGGSWPIGISIVGPAGVKGADGINGTNGVAGAKGADGINGTNGTDGAPGTVLLASKFYVVSHYQMNGWHTASCNAGDVATGGGTTPMGGNYPETNASGVPTKWTSEQDNVYVVCLDLP